MSNVFARTRAWGDRNFIALTTLLLSLAMVMLFFAENIFVTIPAGHGGALWLRFFGGTVIKAQYGEGTKVIFPWDKIYIYDLRVQQQSLEVDILTREGLQIAVDVTLRFRLKPEALGAITAFAGPEFVQTLVMPSVGATVRKEASKHTLEEIYSTSRHRIEVDVYDALSLAVDNLIPPSLNPGSEIVILDFWFRSIRLPAILKAAVEATLSQRQLVEQYVHILQREEREKERKIIEAQGIKSFQDTVSSGISENYLRWKGIDATLKLAESTNAKMVIIGGKDGLPLILGPWEGQTAPSAKPGAPAAPVPGSTDAAPPRSPPSSTSMTPSSSARAGLEARPSSASGSPSLSGPAMPSTPLALDPGISMPAAPWHGR